MTHGYRHLLAAITYQAMLDAHSRDRALRRDARAFLVSSGWRALLDAAELPLCYGQIPPAFPKLKRQPRRRDDYRHQR